MVHAENVPPLCETYCSFSRGLGWGRLLVTFRFSLAGVRRDPSEGTLAKEARGGPSEGARAKVPERSLAMGDDGLRSRSRRRPEPAPWPREQVVGRLGGVRDLTRCDLSAFRSARIVVALVSVVAVVGWEGSGLSREGRVGLFKFIFTMLQGRNGEALSRIVLERFIGRLRPDLSEVRAGSEG